MLYHAGGTGGTTAERPEESPQLRALYAAWVGAPPGSARAEELLHTRFHRREKSVTSTLADW